MSKPIIGHLVNFPDGLRGVKGIFYDYIFASNGVWIETKGEHLEVRIPHRLADIKGLAPLEPKVILRHGLIPQRFFDLALSAFMADRYREKYVAVVFGTGENNAPGPPGAVGPHADYHFVIPEQAEDPEHLAAGNQGGGCEVGVSYKNPENAVLDLHSHGRMPATFSRKDDRDETGLRLYGVVGHLNDVPVVQIRVGVYGNFYGVAWDKVFSGSLIGVEDAIEMDIEKAIREELEEF